MSRISRKIPLWKLVGGAAVHAVVPAYGVALGVDGWHLAAGGLQAWLAQVPGFSAWFFAIYGGVSMAATAIAAVVERPEQPDPEALAASHLRMALEKGRGAFGAQADLALERIAALRVDVGDAAVRGVLRDLAMMVEAGRAAKASALTGVAIERLAGVLERHAQAQAEQAQDKALVIATYVEQRYGSDGLS